MRGLQMEAMFIPFLLFPLITLPEVAVKQNRSVFSRAMGSDVLRGAKVFTLWALRNVMGFKK